MKNNYPEIDSLQKLLNEFNISITVSDSELLDNKNYYPAVVFTISGKSFNLFVEDEYEDFDINNPLLSLSLVLNELEIYNEEDDFLMWCKSQMLNASNNSVLTYYKTLGNIYSDIESIIGIISNPISNWDYEMNIGAAQQLRNNESDETNYKC